MRWRGALFVVQVECVLECLSCVVWFVLFVFVYSPVGLVCVVVEWGGDFELSCFVPFL